MSLAAALILDALIGEPEALWRRAPHPVVLAGRLIAALDARLNAGRARRAKGALALGLVIAAALLAGLGVAALPFAPLFEALAAAILLAQRGLADHVGAVAAGLREGLAEGREAVASIVGRDPETLDAAGVARAAIESAAENFSDGVVAPAFWFALAGLPGMAIYKAVNTADSMIGHRTARHGEFGWAAARLDDLLNLIPARLSALLIAAANGSWAPFRQAMRDAAGHRSANAGWPEAAAAAALGLALAGPRSYGGAITSDPYMNPSGRAAATPRDIDAAAALIWRAWGALALLVLAAGLAGAAI